LRKKVVPKYERVYRYRNKPSVDLNINLSMSFVSNSYPLSAVKTEAAFSERKFKCRVTVIKTILVPSKSNSIFVIIVSLCTLRYIKKADFCLLWTQMDWGPFMFTTTLRVIRI